MELSGKSLSKRKLFVELMLTRTSVFFCRALDMLYAFFLFWPANVIPLWLLCSLLQFFIPLNMLFRSCCVGLKHYNTHVFAGVIICLAVIVNMIDITGSKGDD